MNVNKSIYIECIQKNLLRFDSATFLHKLCKEPDQDEKSTRSQGTALRQ